MAKGKVRRKSRIKDSSSVEKVNQQIHSDIIEFILTGYSLTDIVEYLNLNYNIAIEYGRKLYRQAHLEILEMGEFDVEVILTQHIFYYEEAIRYFDSIGNYSAKGLAMNAKEKLLKIFEDDEPKVEIENNVNINIEQLNYDIDRLDEGEIEEFNKIFQKVKFLENK